jgi:hypothetical protein
VGVVAFIKYSGSPEPTPVAQGPPPAAATSVPVTLEPEHNSTPPIEKIDKPSMPVTPSPQLGPDTTASLPASIPAVTPTSPPITTPPSSPPRPPAKPTVGFDIHNLAPDIEGEDVHGKPFKLSDYRGNVVMLDFWGNW